PAGVAGTIVPSLTVRGIPNSSASEGPVPQRRSTARTKPGTYFHTIPRGGRADHGKTFPKSTPGHSPQHQRASRLLDVFLILIQFVKIVVLVLVKIVLFIDVDVVDLFLVQFVVEVFLVEVLLVEILVIEFVVFLIEVVEIFVFELLLLRLLRFV